MVTAAVLGLVVMGVLGLVAAIGYAAWRDSR